MPNAASGFALCEAGVLKRVQLVWGSDGVAVVGVGYVVVYECGHVERRIDEPLGEADPSRLVPAESAAGNEIRLGDVEADGLRCGPVVGFAWCR